MPELESIVYRNDQARRAASPVGRGATTDNKPQRVRFDGESNPQQVKSILKANQSNTNYSGLRAVSNPDDFVFEDDLPQTGDQGLPPDVYSTNERDVSPGSRRDNNRSLLADSLEASRVQQLKSGLNSDLQHDAVLPRGGPAAMDKRDVYVDFERAQPEVPNRNRVQPPHVSTKLAHKQPIV